MEWIKKLPSKKRRNVLKKIEQGCTFKSLREYNAYISKMRSYNRLKYKELSGLPKGVRDTIRGKINNGYVFVSYKQYLIDLKESNKEAHLRSGLHHRKYSYSHDDKLTHREKHTARVDAISNAYIASAILEMPVSDIPADILELKRVNIQIKRAIGLGNSVQR
jgi:RNA recognition motif-containing protein